ALDIVLWAAAPSLFLFVYVGSYSAPLDSVLPHVRLVMCAFLGVTMMRLCMSRLISQKHGSLLAASIIIACALLLVCLYYGLVLIGLHSWAQVISYQLICSYAVQLPVLSEALGISLLVAASTVVVVVAVVMVTVRAYLRHFDWTVDFVRELSPWRF